VKLKSIKQNVSAASGLSPNKINEVINHLNKAIIAALKEKGRIQINNFGVFSLKKMASKPVFNISKKSGKILLLDRNMVKFMPSFSFKLRIAKTSKAKQQSSTESQTFNLLPNLMPNLRQQIKNIFAKGEKIAIVNHPGPEQSPAMRLFNAIIQSSVEQNLPYLIIELNSDNYALIKYNKNNLLTKIPKIIAENYLRELLGNVSRDIPEEYFVKFAFAKKMSKINNRVLLLRYWTYPSSTKLMVRIQIHE